ncbi:hypothetical protein BCD67_20240 [Oscillatoriales cyanobacterium USR001]|nr:hypothetical protein BCD67_20240 [Oscillatoriales cyanobacterium USR001]
MARYTGFFIVAVPIERLRQLVIEILQSCNLDIIYDSGDYLMARELPGMVPLPKLVTVEVLIEKSSASQLQIRIDLVIKNEELPLQTHNHCRQMFEVVSELIITNRQWQLVESMGI